MFVNLDHPVAARTTNCISKAESWNSWSHITVSEIFRNILYIT